MPAPDLENPQFNLYGRYALNVADRKVKDKVVLFHDTEALEAGCGLDGVGPNLISRFNNPKWAVQRGYVACELCILPVEGSL